MIAGHVMQEIREDMDRLPILQKIDISDYANMNKDFREKIRNKGVLLD